MAKSLYNLFAVYIELWKYNYTVKTISKNPLCIILLSPYRISESRWPIQQDISGFCKFFR
jgi:hypothetical protein